MTTRAINHEGKISLGVLALEARVQRRQKRGSEGYDRAPVEKAQSSLGVRRFAQAELDPHGREETSDQDVSQDLDAVAQTLEDAPSRQPIDSRSARRPRRQLRQGQDGEGKRA